MKELKMLNIVGIIQFLKILKEHSSLKLFGPQLSLGGSLLACSYQSYVKTARLQNVRPEKP